MGHRAKYGAGMEIKLGLGGTLDIYDDITPQTLDGSSPQGTWPDLFSSDAANGPDSGGSLYAHYSIWRVPDLDWYIQVG